MKRKPWLCSSVATYRFVHSKISLSISEKKKGRSSRNAHTKYNLEDGVTALAQRYVLHSDRTRFFDWWQDVLYRYFIITSIGWFVLHRLKSCYGPLKSCFIVVNEYHWCFFVSFRLSMDLSIIRDGEVKRNREFYFEP